MRERKLAELVLDFNLYPRTSVDMTHVGYLRDAHEAKATLPPIVVCAKSLRIADGVHRYKMYLGKYGPEHEVAVLERRYRNDAELLADALRMNAGHGKTLSRCDRVHCLLLAEKVHLTLEEASVAMGMTLEVAATLRAGRVATTLISGRSIALKQTIRHMAGRELSEQQVAANSKLGGMNQLFYVNQLVSLFEAGLLDTGNTELMSRLDHLASLIAGMKAVA